MWHVDIEDDVVVRGDDKVDARSSLTPYCVVMHALKNLFYIYDSLS